MEMRIHGLGIVLILVAQPHVADSPPVARTGLQITAIHPVQTVLLYASEQPDSLLERTPITNGCVILRQCIYHKRNGIELLSPILRRTIRIQAPIYSAVFPVDEMCNYIAVCRLGRLTIFLHFEHTPCGSKCPQNAGIENSSTLRIGTVPASSVNTSDETACTVRHRVHPEREYILRQFPSDLLFQCIHIPKLEIVDVNLQITNDLTAVQTVFEKINSTGKPLEPADLIRNYLLISNSYSEQKSLYDNYWVKIEEQIKTENISRFARDYLIMKTFNDVVNDKIYTDFKNHFESEKTAHVEILGDMLKYSKFYSWIKFESSPSNKINKCLLILNLLKTDDLYPLYLYLLEKLYDSNEAELIKMLDLLCDFMLRYRIVSPSGGGGALRAAIQRIIELYSEGYCEPTYDSLLYELSNSPTSANRYPNDEEFKDAMKNYINLSNARVLLMRIEESERYNIPVDITKVTVEHIMPQTRTEWWIDNLGGVDEAERIYETYLNCIGNLAPISQSYNSKNSNKSWDIKRENLREVQFVITSETANNDEWTEKEIIARNEDIAERAVKAVKGPSKRERPYQSKDPSSVFEAGQYDLSDLQTPMEGASVEELIYDGESIKVDSFKELFYKVCEIAYNYNKEKFADIVDKNLIHKSTSIKNTEDKDPIITTRPEFLHTAEPLLGTPYFIEGALSSMRIRVYSNQLLTEFDDLLSKFKIYLS